MLITKIDCIKYNASILLKYIVTENILFSNNISKFNKFLFDVVIYDGAGLLFKII